MKTQSQQINERLKKIRAIDKTPSVDNLLIVLKSDLTQLFSNYMYVRSQNIFVDASQDDEGNIIITAQVKTDHLLDFGSMI
ncbi:MAG: hypothetical protein FWC11_05645 [Firmicutes bacterium]|nr:hypothetical protein [Bacillota bacterium]